MSSLTSNNREEEDFHLLASPVNYALEYEFLVAKEKPGIYYRRRRSSSASSLVGNQDTTTTTTNNPTDSDSDHSPASSLASSLASFEDATANRNTRWVCPAEQTAPLQAILLECKEVLVKNDQCVAIKRVLRNGQTHEQVYNPSRAGESPVWGHWLLEAAEDAKPVATCSPEEYEWLGVRLRTPMYEEEEMRTMDSSGTQQQMKWCLGALRMAFRIHVNSTCKLGVHVQPDLKPLDLLAAKKLTSLILTLERTLLVSLCPVKPWTRFIAGRSDLLNRYFDKNLHLYQENIPKVDPAISQCADLHVPEKVSPCLRGRLRAIWAMRNLSDLSQFLHHQFPHSPMAFSITLPNTAGDMRPTAVFRYGLWHPHDGGLDTTNMWATLCIHMVKMLDHEEKRFSEAIRRLWIKLEYASRVRKNERVLQRELLREELGMPRGIVEEWCKVLDEYNPGGKLADDKIDCFGALKQVEKLRLLRSD